jgi:putative acetyltransferase
MEPIIRAETAADVEAVHRVNELAFGRSAEANLVDALRFSVQPIISLVAILDDQVVGHILFSPVTIESEAEVFAAMGLAPVAVRPDYQNRGVGAALIRSGLAECRRLGHEIVVVLGHPAYYPRFGFVTASTLGIRCEFDVPDEAYMVAELTPGALRGRRGVVHYRPEFQGV